MDDDCQDAHPSPPQTTHESNESPSVQSLNQPDDRPLKTILSPLLSKDILNAIKGHDINELLTLVLHSELIESGKSWKPSKEDIPRSYHSLPGESIEVLDFALHPDYEEQIAHAVSISVEGCLPVHELAQVMVDNKSPTGKGFSLWGLEWRRRMTIYVCLKILGGFDGSGSAVYWRQLQPNGKNALHIAASRDPQTPGSDLAVRMILELLALNHGGNSISHITDLDELTKVGNTSLHLAMPRPWIFSDTGEAMERLVLAGANVSIQNLSDGETVLHLLASGKASGDDRRLRMINIVLRHLQNEWQQSLTAENHMGHTAMGKALESEDYNMVIALFEARISSFNLTGKAKEIWARDRAHVQRLALDSDEINNSIRGSLFQALARDDNAFIRRDESGMTVLQEACNLTEDRDDIVSALLKALYHADKIKAFSGARALSLAARKHHSLTVSVMLDHGAVDDLSSVECFSLIKSLRDEGRTMMADLIQHYRTHRRVNVLRQPRHSEQRKELELFAMKWPSQVTWSWNREEDEEGGQGEAKDGLKQQRRAGFSIYCREEGVQAFSAFKYSLYASRHLVSQIVYCDEHTLLHTWTRRNGGWIHLPANNREWVEDICRSSYINEHKFPTWLKAQVCQSNPSEAERRWGLFPRRNPDWNAADSSAFWSSRDLEELAPDVNKILGNTYTDRTELTRFIPSDDNPSESGWGSRAFGEHRLGYHRGFDEYQSRSRTPSPRSERRREALNVECQKVLTFVGDSLLEAQKLSSQHRRVMDGLRSLVVQRQDQLDPQVHQQHTQPDSGKPGGPPGPDGATITATEYTVKSIVLPILDVDWIRPFLDPKVPRDDDCGNKSSDDLNLGQSQSQHTSECNSLAEDGVYRTRVAESLAIVKSERQLRIDQQQRDHCDQMSRLYKEIEPVQDCGGIRMPLSLDQYFHQDLVDDEIQDRISSQVVSRFIFYQRQIREQTGQQEEPFSTVVGKFRRSTGSKLDEDIDLEIGSADKAAQPSDEAKAKIDTLFRQKILIVPQLWLLKVDNTLITSFPDQWDGSNLGFGLPALFSKQVQTQPRDIKADDLLHMFFECALKYQPSFSAFGERFTYDEAFSGEIRRLSRIIEQCYEDFHQNVGSSDRVFLNAFHKPTYCLRTIDDVLHELDMIKRVFQDQTRVWEDFHNAFPHPDLHATALTSSRKCPYSNTCDPKVIPQRLFTTVSNLVEEAKIVQESAVTLLTLLQGEASTENTIKTSEQSQILFVFTVITVIFAPLSWISAIFALQVQNTTWTWRHVVGGSFASVLITLGLCAIVLLLMNWEGTKNYWKKTIRDGWLHRLLVKIAGVCRMKV